MEKTLFDLAEHAKLLYSQKKFKESEEEFNSLLQSNYKKEEVHYYLGLINFSTQNYRASEEHLLKVIELEPKNINALYYLGEIFYKKGKKDIALFYFSNVLDINPNHKNAQLQQSRILSENLHSRNLNNNISSANNSTSYIPEDDSLTHQGEVSLDASDIYEQLKKSNDPFSKAAVQMIESTKLVGVRPRLTAYLQQLLFTPILLIVSGFILAFIFENESDNNYSVIMLIYLVFSLLVYTYLISKIKSIKVDIDRGIIQITKGVFSRSVDIYEIYRITSFQVHQSFFNQITGDGTLIFDPGTLQRTSKRSPLIKLRGIAKYKELKDLALKLRSIHLQLRSTNINKGIIQ